MPFVLRPPIRKIGISFALAAAALVFAVLPAAASADCPDTPTSQIFSQYGDFDEYTPVAGGSFTFGATGWYVDNAKTDSAYALTPADAPHLLNGTQKSLRIDRQGYAVSPEMCVSVRHPTFRFFAYKRSGGAGDLNLALYYATTDGDRGRFALVGSLDPASFAGWGLGAAQPLARALPLQGDETAQVRLVFFYGYQPDGSVDSTVKNQWRIDEVYVDPYRR